MLAGAGVLGFLGSSCCCSRWPRACRHWLPVWLPSSSSRWSCSSSPRSCPGRQEALEQGPGQAGARPSTRRRRRSRRSRPTTDASTATRMRRRPDEYRRRLRPPRRPLEPPVRLGQRCPVPRRRAGDGPLVLLMHGFPQFWWAWRAQMARSPTPATGRSRWTCVATAPRTSRRAATTRTPWPPRSRRHPLPRRGGRHRRRPRLGRVHRLVHADLQPAVVRAVGSLSMPHPRSCGAPRYRPGPVRANAYLVDLQRPFVPEREMTKDPALRRRGLRSLGRARGC